MKIFNFVKCKDGILDFTSARDAALIAAHTLSLSHQEMSQSQWYFSISTVPSLLYSIELYILSPLSLFCQF